MRTHLKFYFTVIGFAVAILGLLTIWIQSTKIATPSMLVGLSTPPLFTAKTPSSPATHSVVPKAPNRVYEYKDMIVGLIQVGSESAWRVANKASFRETAIALGIKLKYFDIADPRNYQVVVFQQLLDDPEVNVIILSAIEATGWEDVLQRAKDAGKVVILSDRHINAPENLYATFVGNDFVEEGRKAGIQMCKLLEGSKKKNIWELAGIEGSQAAKERGMGFRERAGECGIVIANSQTGNFYRTEGKQVTEAWLKDGSDVQGIFAQNDEMGLGAIEALKEVGIAPAVDIKIVSIDAISGAFQAMLNGELNATVECNPLFAPQIYEAALAALNGATLPRWIPVEEGVFHMDDPNLQEIAASRNKNW